MWLTQNEKRGKEGKSRWSFHMYSLMMSSLSGKRKNNVQVLTWSCVLHVVESHIPVCFERRQPYVVTNQRNWRLFSTYEFNPASFLSINLKRKSNSGERRGFGEKKVNLTGWAVLPNPGLNRPCSLHRQLRNLTIIFYTWIGHPHRIARRRTGSISAKNPGRNLWYHNKSDLKSSTRAPKIPP
jgi:hypothetical protein